MLKTVYENYFKNLVLGYIMLLLWLQSARYSKLEKADILELTVRHLRDVQRNNVNCKCN